MRQRRSEKRFSQGLGVRANPREALRWNRMGARRGSAFAMLNLGLAYERGQGVAKQPRRAFTWFLKAAQSGDAEAQEATAEALQKGAGVMKND